MEHHTTASDGTREDRRSWNPSRAGIHESTHGWSPLLLATGDLDLATEGVDEACARALACWERVSVMDAPTGWAYSVALNHVCRVARRRSLERTLLRRSVPQPNVPAPAGEVWDLVAALPERQRQVVVLRHVADLKEAQIASVLNISRSTVSTTLRDAHQRLGSLLDDGVEITHANSNLDTKETTDV